MISTVQMEKAHALSLVQACFIELTDETERAVFRPSNDDAFREIEEQRSMAQERIVNLKSQMVARDYDGCTKKLANDLLRRTPPNASVSATLTADLLEGVTRALIEQQRLFMQRLEDRLMPYNPDDPLFTKPAVIAVANMTQVEPHVGPSIKGESLGYAIGAYSAEAGH